MHFIKNNSLHKYLPLFISIFFFSCFEDQDDNFAYASEINDFVWKGMNAAYLYKEEIYDLSNDRFDDSNEYTEYLGSEKNPYNVPL